MRFPPNPFLVDFFCWCAGPHGLVPKGARQALCAHGPGDHVRRALLEEILGKKFFPFSFPFSFNTTWRTLLWREFTCACLLPCVQEPIVVKHPAKVTHVEFSPVPPYDFAVSSSLSVRSVCRQALRTASHALAHCLCAVHSFSCVVFVHICDCR